MISNFIIALVMFFSVNFGQVNSNDIPGKTPPKQEMPEKTIIEDLKP